MRDPSHAILSIGTLAADWLAGGQGGRVLASVTRAIYLLSEQNELLWITPQPGPMHRRCILVSAPLPSMEAGVEFETKNGLLTTGAREALEFASASIWRPPVITRFETIDARALRPLVHGIYRQLTAQEKPLGWGALIPEVLRGGEGQPAPAVFGDGILDSVKVWPSVGGIVRACLAHDPRSVEEHAGHLIGLGTGLTPSGDDFLGGLFFSISILGSAFPDMKHVRAWRFDNFIRGSRSQTNAISFALLQDHNEGHALEPLHHFAKAILTGQLADHCLLFARALAAVGHSTGWDLLTGFLTGMSLAFTP